MAKNNICKSLIVYGSWGPGGKQHHLLEHLPGQWESGKMLVGSASSDDDIYSGEGLEKEAWIIKFADCDAKIFTPEWQQQKLMLYDRWTELDQLMGHEIARGQRSWWPKDKDPIRGKNGQLVVNIYLPLKNFAHLKNITDTPHPEEENNIRKLWQQQLSGEKKYDWNIFIALIKDFTLEECMEMFKGLSGIEKFKTKLSTLYQDLAYESGYLLKQEGEAFYMYALPRPEHQISNQEAARLVQKELEQKARLHENQGNKTAANLLRNVDYKFANLPEEEQEYEGAFLALSEANDLINDSKVLGNNWQYCLSEACYGIAANFILPRFLMDDFYSIDQDYEIPYRIWKGGWKYEIHQSTCYVFSSKK